MEAERLLLAADVSRGKRRKVIDKMAAVLILQSYLQAHLLPARIETGKIVKIRAFTPN